MSADKIKNAKCLGQLEVMDELKLARKEERPADFSHKAIGEFPLILDKVKFGLNLEGATILGPLFFGEIVIEGDLILKDAVVNGPLHLAMSEVMGDFSLENASISGTVNMVGLEVGGSLRAEGMVNRGFLSLSKAVIDGSADFERVKIESAKYQDLTVRGDVFLDGARVKGSLNLSRASADGIIDLDSAVIGKDLVMSQTKSKKGKIETSGLEVGGRKIS